VNPNTQGHPRRYDARRTDDVGACAAVAPRCAADHRCIGGRCQWDNGWVHFNSSIINHAVYLLSEGGTHADTGIAVRGIGVGKVERMWFLALDYLNASATMEDMRDAVVAACLLELIGRGTPAGVIERRDCGAAMNAFAAVDIGLPDPDEDALVPPFDNCPNDYNPDQLDTDDDGMGDACDPDGPDAGVGDGGVGVTCAGDQLACPATWTNSEGVTGVVLHGASVDVCPELIGDTNTYRVGCVYAEPGAPASNGSFELRYTADRTESVGCNFDSEGLHPWSPEHSFLSQTAEVSLVYYGPDMIAEDPAREPVARDLIAQVEGWGARPCERIECPESFTDGTGTYELSAASGYAGRRFERSGDPPYTAATCAYDTRLSFSLTWAAEPDEVVECPETPPYNGAASTTSQAQVTFQTIPDETIDATRRAFAQSLLPQIEAMAQPCP